MTRGRPSKDDDNYSAEAVARWQARRDAGATDAAIAVEFGIGWATVRRKLGPSGRNRGAAPRADASAELVAETYGRLKSIRATAAELGVSAWTIRARLGEYRQEHGDVPPASSQPDTRI